MPDGAARAAARIGDFLYRERLFDTDDEEEDAMAAIIREETGIAEKETDTLG